MFRNSILLQHLAMQWSFAFYKIWKIGHFPKKIPIFGKIVIKIFKSDWKLSHFKNFGKRIQGNLDHEIPFLSKSRNHKSFV